MKNTHHHRDYTTTYRTPCIHLSNSHCTVFTKACVPTRHQCEPLEPAGGFDRCLLLFRYSLNVHSRDVHPCIFDRATMSTPAISAIESKLKADRIP